MDETLQTKAETLPTRQTKRSSAFMHMDVMNACDEVEQYAEQYTVPSDFIRAVILELERSDASHLNKCDANTATQLNQK